ncbi:MAG: DUF4388 domain-containing protein [Kofleriaceae bacterium]
MSKQSLLLVDGDTRSLRVLEVSLRKAGFTVTPASSVADALDKLELHVPDLIISETKFATDADGFELRRRVRDTPDWAAIPFVFLTAETAIEHKIRGLELGVDDYLTKPIYIKEIVTRINILLQKRQRSNFDERKDGVRFAGRVADMPVVDVIQTIEVSRKSGIIQFTADRHRTAAIYFRDGRVIDAEAGTLQGEDAVYRLLTWSEGEFEVVFRTVRRREVINASSQGLLMEGMRRLDEWSRLLEQLPPLSHRFEIDTAELAARLGEVPDDNNPILRLIDGKRSLLEVIDSSDFGDLECLQAISRLYFEGLLVDLDPEQRPKRDTGKPMPLVMIDPSPTPIEEVASGPIHAERGAHVVEEITPPPKAAPVDHDEPRFSGEDEAPALGAPPQPVDTEVSESEVLSEEDVRAPLTGSYRPSSLRLIDEAVAAAQAIDPSLFADEPKPGRAPSPNGGALARMQLQSRESDPRIANARGVVEKSDIAERSRPSSVPPAIKNAILSSEITLPTDDELADGMGATSVERMKSPTTPPDGVRNVLPDLRARTPSNPPELSRASNPLISRTPSNPNNPIAGFSSPGTPPEIARARTTSTPPVNVEAPAPRARAARQSDSPIELAPQRIIDDTPDDDGVPREMMDDDEDSSRPIDRDDHLGREEVTEPERPPFIAQRDSTGRRMTSSHGHDRAEASGELNTAKPKTNPDVAGERELVTIMPRRITREVPEMPALAAALTAPSADKAATAEPVEPPPRVSSPALPPPRVATVAGGTSRPSGPGPLAIAGLVGASLLAGMAIYLAVHKNHKAAAHRDAGAVEMHVEQPPGYFDDAGEIATSTPDAAQIAVAPIDARVITPDAAHIAVAPPIDAGSPPDAARVAVATPDAGVSPRPDAGAAPAVDKNKEAASLRALAQAAIDEGDPDKALELVDQSLALRKTSQAYLVRANALTRLSRNDDALAALNAASELTPSFGTVLYRKGMLLRSMKRYDESKATLQQFLDVAPTDSHAEEVKALLQQP